MNAAHGPLEIYRTTVVEPWIDYNGHMNEGYYAVAFGDASDAYLTHAGFGEEYRQSERGTFYTVETHVRFFRELKLGDPISCETIVLGVDPKRIHLYHSLLHAAERYEAATQEALLLHVDIDDVRVRPMGADLLAMIATHRDAHGELRPAGVGSAIRPVGG